MLHNVLLVFVIDQMGLCVFEFILSRHRDDTFPVPEALTACLLFWMLSVKKEAILVQALVDRSSEFGFWQNVRSEKLLCIFQFQIIKAKPLFIDVKMNLEFFCFAPCVQLTYWWIYNMSSSRLFEGRNPK